MGELISMDLVNTTQKFQLEKKVGTKEFIQNISNYYYSWVGWLEMALV